jgi:hypothetical protein
MNIWRNKKINSKRNKILAEGDAKVGIEEYVSSLCIIFTLIRSIK